MDSESAPAPGPKILVVDDDAVNLRTFVRVFRDRYRIATAGSGREALEILAREHVDVALVDHSMPSMTGLELLKVMERRHPDVKRVMLTAYGDLPELRAAVAAGLAMTIVMKPWERSEVLTAVEHALRLSAMKRGVEALRDALSGSSK